MSEIVMTSLRDLAGAIYVLIETHNAAARRVNQQDQRAIAPGSQFNSDNLGVRT